MQEKSKSCANVWKLVNRLLVGGLFCYAGYMHFKKPGLFIKAVPPYLPLHKEIVALSGVFEILGGLGLFAPQYALRRAAGWGLMALLVAVFPANIYMAMDSAKFAPIPPVVLWLRLPFQFAFIAWVNWVTAKVKSEANEC